ncbi:MAG: TIGR03088 family PEP-CTERM/XrtA system glycosyltransferase [Gammaproteobacteria bacterium]|nr:TIGR03088 family PEP-CTERM/XrtA system glycosyltransferase [Gammaproteobacteria bacterium]
MNRPPLIVHIIYRLAIGGLENGLVNLINRTPQYRHAIICADDFTDFKNRIQRDDVEVYALKKRPGNDYAAQFRLWKLLRKLRADLVHTRNLGTIEYVVPAMLAGVRHRIHGEHGRDMSDIDGTNKKYIFLRKVYAPFFKRFIALSVDLEEYLLKRVGLSRSKVVQLYNGVDISRFQPKYGSSAGSEAIVFGTVGRLQAEKDQANLIRAFACLSRLMENNSHPLPKVSLKIIGDGPDRERLHTLIEQENLGRRVTLFGASDDIPAQLKTLDVFILPSLGEGISNTILEAMATGLPVIATRVGGNPELVVEGETGTLVPPAEPEKMAEAMFGYVQEPARIEKEGRAGRLRVENRFSIDSMVNAYQKVYDEILGR